MAEGGEAVESVEAEFENQHIFIDTARLKEALQEDEVVSNSPEKNDKLNTDEKSVTVEQYTEPLVQSSNALSRLDPSGQRNTSSSDKPTPLEVHFTPSSDKPTPLEVHFTPSASTEVANTEERVGASTVAKPSELTPSQEQGDDRTNAREGSGGGVLHQITSSGGAVSELEQQQVPVDGRQVSASNRVGELGNHGTSCQTSTQSTRSEQNGSESNALGSGSVETSEQQTLATVLTLYSSTVSETVNVADHPPATNTPTSPGNISPSHLTPSSNTQDTSAQSRPPMSPPIATPTAATPTQRGATSSLEPQSPTADLGVSPYVMVRGGGGGGRGLMEVPQFESPGLLYAKSTKERHNLDMLRPPDEVAEDVLEMIGDDPSNQPSWIEEEEEREVEVDGEWDGEGGGGDRSMSHLLLTESGKRHRRSLPLYPKEGSLTSLESPDEVSRPLSPLDPNAVRDLELQAKKVASSLDYIMENLHNSLHAMTVCSKQSVMLHRESVDSLHTVVDTNVKATYSFLAKFEELKKQTVPLHTLSQQIKDINKILKVLERNFRTV